jgi:hypothetical protein
MGKAALSLSEEDYRTTLWQVAKKHSAADATPAELEALLFRKSRGDLFDLPAYREVLFLYALARDLFDHESDNPGTVDLLLPLHAKDDMHSTRPAPFDDPAHAPPDGADDAGGRPTAPVDLDLSTPDKSTSIFDPFDPFDPNERRGPR